MNGRILNWLRETFLQRPATVLSTLEKEGTVHSHKHKMNGSIDNALPPPLIKSREETKSPQPSSSVDLQEIGACK